MPASRLYISVMDA